MITLFVLTLVIATPQPAHAKTEGTIDINFAFLRYTPEPVRTFIISTPIPTQEPTPEPTPEPEPVYQPQFVAQYQGNGYYWGQCVWYAKNRRPDIPSNWGNARDWLWHAQEQGWPTGSEPSNGAVVSLNESYYGHVAIVEGFDSQNIYISEMNVQGVGVQSSRAISRNSWEIQGFIY